MPVNKALIQITFIGGLIELTNNGQKQVRKVSPATSLSFPGLLLCSASRERLESSAGANKAGHYATGWESKKERERRESKRKADDDVT